MDGIKNLLLNILFILLPIFVYQTFWADKAQSISAHRHRRHRTAIAVLSSLSLILCITFPVYSIPGFIIDLRLLPLWIAILYGGYGAGLFTTVVMFTYRAYFGGLNPGFYHGLMSFPVSIAVACLFVPRFLTFSRNRKRAVFSLLTIPQLFATYLFVIGDTGTPVWKNPYLPLFGAFIAIYLFSIWLTVYLIENIREKIVMRLEIQRAEKLQVLGDLAASIAHEIRNPMTVVRGFLQLLQENQVPEDKRQAFLQMGIEELDRSETIISNYLSFARPQTAKQLPVNVAERIAHCVGIISSYATLHNVQIHTTDQSELFVEGDPEKLSQVLINLIKNAIEAMASGGTIEITANKQQEQVLIHVIDFGIGMSPEQVARLGDPYFSTKETGTGLGLMVSFQIIRSMGGHIHAISEIGKGTQFTITLPAYR